MYSLVYICTTHRVNSTANLTGKVQNSTNSTCDCDKNGPKCQLDMLLTVHDEKRHLLRISYRYVIPGHKVSS